MCFSFIDCYESEFGRLERASEGRGVPLEHLISCIQGIEIAFADNGMKRVQWHEKKDGENSKSLFLLDYIYLKHVFELCDILLLLYIFYVVDGPNQPLATQLAQFGRELVDLLKTFPKCTLSFARLIPSYHAHFGR